MPENSTETRVGGSLQPDCSAMARKLHDAQDYLQNATSGLAHHIHERSPIMRDIVAADKIMEEARLWILSQNRQ